MNEQTVTRKPGRPRLEITEDTPASTKRLAKTVQLGIGIDLLGSAMSLNNRKGNELEVTSLGVEATSKKFGRVVLIPWSNIRGLEFI